MSLRRDPNLNLDAVFADLGYEPHDGQRLVHESQARRRIVSCGVRWGKSLCAAIEAILAALLAQDRCIGWVVAPTYDLADRVFREIELYILERMRHRLVQRKESERRIVLRNIAGELSEIRAKSADNPDSLLGEGLDFVIVDEASRLKPRIWNSFLTQRLIDKDGWALLISTPRGRGYFYDLFRRGQGAGHDPDFESWNMPSWTNPLLDRELIEAERKRLPQAAFRQEFGAEFIEGSGAVFRNVRECATGELKDPMRGERYVAGLDLAKVEDFTVLCVLNSQRELVAVDRFHKLDWSLQMQRIKAMLQRFNNAPVLVDSTGAGEPIYEAMRREGLQAKAYPFTAKTKSALIDNLTLMFEQRKIVLPTPELWPDGIDELESFEFSVTEQGYVKTGAPSGVHDDCVIALALAAWEVREDRPVYRITSIPRRGSWAYERRRFGLR